MFSPYYPSLSSSILMTIGPRCLPERQLLRNRTSQLSVLASFTPLFKELINYIFTFLNIFCIFTVLLWWGFTTSRGVVIKTQSQDTISRKTAIQQPNLASDTDIPHRTPTRHFHTDFNRDFYYHPYYLISYLIKKYIQYF